MPEMPDKSKKVQFNIYLPERLVRTVKHTAVDENQSLSAFTENALLHYLAHLDADKKPLKSRGRIKV